MSRTIIISDKNGVFTFEWIICSALILHHKGSALDATSQTVEASTVKGTKWYLRVRRSKSDIPGNFMCYLCRHKDDDYPLNTSVTYKLELSDITGKILKSIEKECITFDKGTSHGVANFLDQNFLELCREAYDPNLAFQIVTFRCCIIYESYKKHVTIQEIPTSIHKQWKINALGPENWSQSIKVPFIECNHIDIIISASNERISIEIEKVDLVQPYELQIAVLTEENSKIDCKITRNTDENPKLQTWVEKSQIVDKSRFHLPYSFTLICSITTSCGDSHPNTESCKLNDSIPSLVSSGLPLVEDLKKMLLDDKHSDVILRSQDKTMTAHKCLLSARSSVFSTMFDQDMLETQTGIVDIPDVESETLQSFLEFLYTDAISNTDCERILELMLVADKYQVDCLKERCSVIVMSKLSTENVCEVASVSEMVNLPNLKLCAFNFIRQNKKKIISSPAWSVWMEKNVKLALEILSKLVID